MFPRYLGYLALAWPKLTLVKVCSPDGDPAIVAREKALVWKQDLRIVPLCAGIYLLCYLDRSNIGMFGDSAEWRVLIDAGNAKILNEDTHNDLLSETNMTSYQFT